MADAVLSYFPEAKLTLGPPTDDGFYYDIDLPRPLTPEDLERIEARMKEIIRSASPFVEKELSRDEAKQVFAKNPYKLEIIDSIPASEKITTYTHGKFTDLCEGPHVGKTTDVAAVKLLNVAGAYWRGDEKRPMLQRIYGTAFESQKALDEHLAMLEEAAKRDHRKLGRELDLFIFDPVAPAMPFFLPKGAIVYNGLVDYIRDLYKKHGYDEVVTPQVLSTEIWKRSGHYDHYLENMYLLEKDERELGLKAMNCPVHAIMFAARVHSYREMPVRYADFGRLHRYERSGVTHGLARVRSFAQDDAHIFCRPDQINAEITSFVSQFFEIYQMFGFGKVQLRLSLRPDNRIGSDELWDRAEGALADALRLNNLAFTPMPGEGAFYGPKIDFLVSDALGREWQLGTLQLDFNLANRFDLEYVAEDGSRARPVVVHRAWLGSVERFLGILIEHLGGAFPVWLAPVQAVLIPIADRHIPYAESIATKLKTAGLRAEVDARGERMNLKIRDAQTQKVPYMLVVGDREEAEGKAAVRLRSGENRGAVAVDAIVQEIKGLAQRRA
jgi:threonyl-tRNA synthetase